MRVSRNHSRFTILDCDSCDTPMAVLGEHRADPTAEERAFMVEALSLIARSKYGAGEFIIDGVMRQIPDLLLHARPTDTLARVKSRKLAAT